MTRKQPTREQQAAEDAFLAGLTPDEEQEYRVHVEAGGRTAWEYAEDPTTPLYPDMDMTMGKERPPFDYDKYDLTNSRGAAEALAAAFGDIKDHMTEFAQNLGRVDSEIGKRRDAAAKRLGVRRDG